MSTASAADWIPLTAALVQETDYNANCAFGRVLITFDPKRRDDLLFLDRILSRISALRGKRSLTADEQTAADLVTAPPDKSRWQRWDLPTSVTDGVPVALCDLPLYFRSLPYGADTLSRPDLELAFLPCRAKIHGGIELLPYTRRGLHDREDEFVRQVEKNGVRLTAARVQANGALYSPGTESLPGLVLVTFDSNISDRDTFLRKLADRLYDLKQDEPRTEDEREVRDIVKASERGGVRHRRRRLPSGFTGGPAVYAADLIIRPRYLRKGYLTDAEKMLPCVAEAGPSGAIEHLPYWEATGEAPPPVVAPDVLDVTDQVLGDPIPVVPTERPRSAPPPRTKTPIILLLVLLVVLFGGAFTCVGGGAIWYFALRNPVTLSNPHPTTLIMMRQGTTVDYEFRRNPDPKLRYHLVARNPRANQTIRTTIGFPPSRGTFTITLPVTVAFGLSQRTEYEIYMEAEPTNGSGSAERVSNVLTVTP